MLPGVPSVRSAHYSRKLETNGYDTDSSQDSRGRPGSAGNGHSRSTRPWKPMREPLNVDSVSSATDNADGAERQQISPPRWPSGKSVTRERDLEVMSGGREERKPNSLMTIYEDDQRHENGSSRSSLESIGRGGYGDKERSKGTATLKVYNDNWKIQRTESGYESSDRISNSSANLDSPVVENFPPKELQSIGELQLTR